MRQIQRASSLKTTVKGAMHVKIEFKLRKGIREKTLEFPEFAADLKRLRKRGLSVVDALKALLKETAPRSGRSRAAAAEILSRSGAADVTKILLQQLPLARGARISSPLS